MTHIISFLHLSVWLIHWLHIIRMPIVLKNINKWKGNELSNVWFSLKVGSGWYLKVSWSSSLSSLNMQSRRKNNRNSSDRKSYTLLYQGKRERDKETKILEWKSQFITIKKNIRNRNICFNMCFENCYKRTKNNLLICLLLLNFLAFGKVKRYNVIIT